MAETSQLLRRNLLEVFGERDATKRAAVIAEIYVDEPVCVDPHGATVGRAGLVATVEGLQARFPDFVFTQLGRPDAHHDIGRLAWGYGPPGAAWAVTGLDVVLVEDGRIARLYTFLDGEN
jgi:hypothetical protein